VFCEVRVGGFPEVRSGEQRDKLLLQGSRLLFRAGWNASLLAGYLSPIIRWALLLLRRWALLLRWGLLPRTRPYRFEGRLGLNRRRLAIIRDNRLDVRIDRFDIRTGGGLLLGWRLVAGVLLLAGVSLRACVLLIGTEEPTISVHAAALAHAPATDRGASTRAGSSP
jgi:hypothetical protein